MSISTATATASRSPDCLSGQRGYRSEVIRVIDGDSVELAGGLSVRMIGINSLELHAANDDHRHQAMIAREALRELIEGRQVEVIPGRETHDAHQRRLVHLRDSQGSLVSAHLVAQGLAVAVATGRNTRCADYLRSLESASRRQRRGLWQRLGERSIGSVETADAGGDRFVLFGVTVERTDLSNGQLVIRLSNGVDLFRGRFWPVADGGHDPFLTLAAGDRIRVRGWLDMRADRPRLTLHHPANLELL